MAGTPPVATEPAGQKQTKRWNSTRRPFYRSPLHRQMPGLVFAPPHSLMSRFAYGENCRSSLIEMPKMGEFYGLQNTKKELEYA
jgi:hypothetical protein